MSIEGRVNEDLCFEYCRKAMAKLVDLGVSAYKQYWNSLMQLFESQSVRKLVNWLEW